MRPHSVTLKSIIYKVKKIIKNLSPSAIKFKLLYYSGRLVIIPIGFRCYTKRYIKKYLDISLKKSLPFDTGFFSPLSVARVLHTRQIGMSNSNHTVCIKNEKYFDATYGYGIKFNKSTYEEINSIVADRDTKDINKYVDSTFGYYTLDMENEFVLAHYNWHVFAKKDKSKGVYDPILNIKNINNILNRRIERMLNKCNTAEYIFFVFGETQEYKYMMIDDCHFDLNDLSPVENAAKELFPDSFVFVENLNDVNTPNKILSMLNSTKIKKS